jgi:hypothetical protein
MWHLSICIKLIWLNKMISNSTHYPPSKLYWVILHRVCILHFLYSFICWLAPTLIV